MTVFLTILFAVLMFGFLITIHEFGHYLFARIFKVSINEFSIGMGPKLFSKRSKKTNILYSLRLLPIGGYVAMVGEDEDTDDPNALNKKSVWQRLVIMAAGGVFNLVAGVLLSAVFVFMTLGSLGSTQIAYFADKSTSHHVLMKNDIVKEVNGHRVLTASELSFRVMWEAEKPIDELTVTGENGESVVLKNVALLDFTVIRDGKEIELSGVPITMTVAEGLGVGQQDFYVYREIATFSSVIRHIFGETRNNVNQVWASLGALLSGRVGVDQMSGPVGVTDQMTEVAKLGFEYLVMIAGLIAVNLGIFNLLPIPALDGGRIFFLLIEAIRRKPMKPGVEQKINTVALMLLLAFSFFILIKDIVKLFL